jgi:hypothetical protein
VHPHDLAEKDRADFIAAERDGLTLPWSISIAGRCAEMSMPIS